MSVGQSRTATWATLPVILLAIAVLLALAQARPADAHAILLRSDPQVNAELAISPDQVVAFYSEPLDERLSKIEVFDGSGGRVDNEEIVFGPAVEQMSVGIDADLGPGFYTVVWETLSSVDGHLFKGSFPFTVLNEDGTQPGGPRYEASGGGAASTEPPNIVVKWLQLLAGAMLLGALAFTLWVNVPATQSLEEDVRVASRKAVWRSLQLLAWISVAVLAITGVQEMLLQADQLGGFDAVGDVLKNDWGQRWIQRQIVLAGIAIALLVARAAERSGRSRGALAAAWTALLGMLMYQLLVALVSHGNTIPGSFWATAADFLHLVSSSVWIGSLAMLVLFLVNVRSAAEEDRAALQIGHLTRFSTIAATSVIVLIGTGVLNALAQVPDPVALTDTAYGRVLLIKLGVTAVLLAVAGLNAFILRPRLLADLEDGLPADDVRQRMRNAVRVELAIGVAVLFTAAVLILHPTSRQLDQAEAVAGQETEAVVGYEQVQPAQDLLINLTVSPNVVGQNSFRVFLFPQGGGDMGDVLRVRLRFAPPEQGAGQSEIDMEPAGTNAYRAVGPFLVSEGNWTINVDVRRAEIDDVTASFPVPVEAPDYAGGAYDAPLSSGTWLTLAAIFVIMLALAAAVWLAEWPGLAEWSPRVLRVGTAMFVVIGVGMLALSVLPEKETAGSANPFDPTPESIAIGRSLYTQNCATCHGDDGRGDGPQADSLPVAPADFRQHVPYHQDEFFFLVITNGLGEIMPSFGEQLSEEERWHLVNFLKSEFGTDGQQSGQ
jgi:copper transport protein